MIEKILIEERIPYKVIDEDKGCKLIKINSKMHLFYIKSEGNQFIMERDYFDYLDGNAIPYAILCHDMSKKFFYYLKAIIFFVLYLNFTALIFFHIYSTPINIHNYYTFPY